MTIPALLTTLIVSVLIPGATALLTKAAAAAWVKQAVTAALAAASGLLVTATQIDGTAVLSQSSLLMALGTFLATQAAYVGMWKPHGLDALVEPDFGLG